MLALYDEFGSCNNWGNVNATNWISESSTGNITLGKELMLAFLQQLQEFGQEWVDNDRFQIWVLILALVAPEMVSCLVQ